MKYYESWNTELAVAQPFHPRSVKPPLDCNITTHKQRPTDKIVVKFKTLYLW
jgi:hypothetical protein